MRSPPVLPMLSMTMYNAFSPLLPQPSNGLLSWQWGGLL
jgi:hypothetical protein